MTDDESTELLAELLPILRSIARTVAYVEQAISNLGTAPPFDGKPAAARPQLELIS